MCWPSLLQEGAILPSADYEEKSICGTQRLHLTDVGLLRTAGIGRVFCFSSFVINVDTAYIFRSEYLQNFVNKTNAYNLGKGMWLVYRKIWYYQPCSRRLKRDTAPSRNLGPRTAWQCRQECKHPGNSACFERSEIYFVCLWERVL